MKIFFYPLLVIFCLISCNSDRREYAKKVMAMDKRMIEYIDEYYSFRSDLKK